MVQVIFKIKKSSGCSASPSCFSSEVQDLPTTTLHNEGPLSGALQSRFDATLPDDVTFSGDLHSFFNATLCDDITFSGDLKFLFGNSVICGDSLAAACNTFTRLAHV